MKNSFRELLFLAYILYIEDRMILVGIDIQRLL